MTVSKLLSDRPLFFGWLRKTIENLSVPVDVASISSLRLSRLDLRLASPLQLRPHVLVPHCHLMYAHLTVDHSVLVPGPASALSMLVMSL